MLKYCMFFYFSVALFLCARVVFCCVPHCEKGNLLASNPEVSLRYDGEGHPGSWIVACEEREERQLFVRGCAKKGATDYEALKYTLQLRNEDNNVLRLVCCDHKGNNTCYMALNSTGWIYKRAHQDAICCETLNSVQGAPAGLCFWQKSTLDYSYDLPGDVNEQCHYSFSNSEKCASVLQQFSDQCVMIFEPIIQGEILGLKLSVNVSGVTFLHSIMDNFARDLQHMVLDSGRPPLLVPRSHILPFARYALEVERADRQWRLMPNASYYEAETPRIEKRCMRFEKIESAKMCIWCCDDLRALQKDILMRVEWFNPQNRKTETFDFHASQHVGALIFSVVHNRHYEALVGRLFVSQDPDVKCEAIKKGATFVIDGKVCCVKLSRNGAIHVAIDHLKNNLSGGLIARLYDEAMQPRALLPLNFTGNAIMRVWNSCFCEVILPSFNTKSPVTSVLVLEEKDSTLNLYCKVVPNKQSPVSLRVMQSKLREPLNAENVTLKQEGSEWIYTFDNYRMILEEQYSRKVLIFTIMYQCETICSGSMPYTGVSRREWVCWLAEQDDFHNLCWFFPSLVKPPQPFIYAGFWNKKVAVEAMSGQRTKKERVFGLSSTPQRELLKPIYMWYEHQGQCSYWCFSYLSRCTPVAIQERYDPLEWEWFFQDGTLQINFWGKKRKAKSNTKLLIKRLSVKVNPPRAKEIFHPIYTLSFCDPDNNDYVEFFLDPLEKK